VIATAPGRDGEGKKKGKKTNNVVHRANKSVEGKGVSSGEGNAIKERRWEGGRKKKQENLVLFSKPVDKQATK